MENTLEARQKPSNYVFGRPTKYRPEMCAKADEYLALQQDEEGEFHKTRGEKSDSYEQTLTVKLPTLKGFAQFLDVQENTLYDWERTHEDFSKSLDKIRAEQYKRLIEGSLSGKYNPLIAKLMLSHNHGMHEKIDVETTVNVSSIIQEVNTAREIAFRQSGLETQPLLPDSEQTPE